MNKPQLGGKNHIYGKAEPLNLTGQKHHCPVVKSAFHKAWDFTPRALEPLQAQLDGICSWVSCLQHNREGTVRNCVTDQKDYGFNLKPYPTIVNGPISTICSSKESYRLLQLWVELVPLPPIAEGKSPWEAFRELMLVFKADDFPVDTLVVNSFVLISRGTAKNLKQAESKTK